VKKPFGKHYGEDLREIPIQYLEWIRENIDLREPLLSAIDAELERRDGNIPSTSIPPALRPTAKEIITTGYRMLALKLHPDRGGAHDGMVRLTDARKALEGIVNQ
jgi:hypothetical protein